MRPSIACLTLSFLCSLAFAGKREPYEMAAAHEGTYQIRLICREADPKACKELNGPHKMVVMNVQTRNLALVSIRPQFGRASLYGFASTSITKDGQEMEGSWIKDERIAQIHLDFSNTEDDTLGWIRDPKYKEDIRIRGSLAQTTQKFLQTSSDIPLGLIDVVGTYRGQWGTKNVTVNIQSSMIGEGLMATMKDSLVTYRFNEGLLDKERRVVMLWRTETSDEQALPYQKLILPFEADSTFGSEGISFNRGASSFTQLRLQKD